MTRNKILYGVVSSTAKGLQNYILEAIHISDREGHIYILRELLRFAIILKTK